jgi:hypothetical protein
MRYVCSIPVLLALCLAGCGGSRIHGLAGMPSSSGGEPTDVKESAPERAFEPTPGTEPKAKIEPESQPDPLEAMAFPGDLLKPLEHPEKVTFYTLAEEYELEDTLTKEEIKALPEFHGYRVLGKVELVPASEGQSAVEALRAAVRGGTPMSVECFEPHHGIRVESAGLVTDVLVCFICTNMAVYPDGPRNVVELNTDKLEHNWRDIVGKHDLTDISRATWLPDPDDEEEGD